MVEVCYRDIMEECVCGRCCCVCTFGYRKVRVGKYCCETVTESVEDNGCYAIIQNPEGVSREADLIEMTSVGGDWYEIDAFSRFAYW